ncbi:ABC transporter substrate-binding protein [Halocatena halophila]|uniref:ABC transporter substrate-binding protein n=1 Tax=Halocatena halophila TaxID=2814576 RepID=UPI002ED55C21
MRVVTLLPSATDIVTAFGVDPVGVSHECDHPAPAVTESRIDATASSRAIDRQVLQAERNGGVYAIDLDRLEALDPDLIVTQGLCDVCAVDRVLVTEAVETLELDCSVLTTDPHSLDDVREDIQRIGEAIGVTETAATVQKTFDERIENVKATTADASGRPTVAVLDWLEPIMTAGHWVPELVEIAGGEPAFVAERSIPRSFEAIIAADPAVIVIAPCGFAIEQTAANRDELTSREEYDQLRAVQSDSVYAMDGDRLLHRPGTTLADTAEQLGKLLHPALCGQPDEDLAVGFDQLPPAQ